MPDKGVDDNNLKGPYFAPQNLELSFGPERLSQIRLHPIQPIWVYWMHSCIVVCNGLSDIPMHIPKHMYRNAGLNGKTMSRWR